jgi:hypothetical protein
MPVSTARQIIRWHWSKAVDSMASLAATPENSRCVKTLAMLVFEMMKPTGGHKPMNFESQNFSIPISLLLYVLDVFIQLIARAGAIHNPYNISLSRPT